MTKYNVQALNSTSQPITIGVVSEDNFLEKLQEHIQFDVFSATANQTNFTLTYTPTVIVAFADGLLTTNYTISENIITFNNSTSFADNTQIVFYYLY
jgi:hypothetical protein